ncbi:MAG: magnesium/cobalt transporter CorA, partial [Candidatus Margulisiibacteriota bacterium]
NIPPLTNQEQVIWLNVDGLHDTSIIQQIGEKFNLHPLLLEDILNTDQRPKVDDYENYLYIVMKMLYLDQKKELVHEHVSFILGHGYIISFQEQPGDVFQGIRERIKHNKGRVRKAGADYLAYALIDAIVDNYFLILEHFSDKMESVDEELTNGNAPDVLKKIRELKRETMFMRRVAWPLREMVGSLAQRSSELITPATAPYIRDVYDHVIQVIESVETLREMVAGMMEIYNSNISNRMNEVMKVLTVIATLFIPLTFIAGIYGMNFKYMPELEWRWGYYSVWLVMIMVAITMLVYFKKKKWF